MISPYLPGMDRQSNGHHWYKEKPLNFEGLLFWWGWSESNRHALASGGF